MINFLMFAFVKFALWLRYRIRVRGLAEVLGKGSRGILFLPNHPALIDPVIVLSRLFGPFEVRALADRNQIDRFFIRSLARRCRVLPIDDLTEIGTSSDAVRAVIGQCVEALRSGDNIVLYPSGQLQRTRLEDLRAGSGVETILRELPDVRVVLVRTRGLWGSRFSWAGGTEPGVGPVLKQGAWALLRNGLFFTPRREITLELVEPDDLPRQGSRQEINRYLESRYNTDALKNTFVPLTIWERGGTRELPEPTPPRISGDAAAVPQATRRQVREYLAELIGRADFDDTSRLANDLGMDSLAGMELLAWLGAEFGFTQNDITAIQTVGDVMLAACGESISAAAVNLKPVSPKWFSHTGKHMACKQAMPPSAVKNTRLSKDCATLPCPPGLEDMNIPEAFLYQAGRRPGEVIAADQAGGVKTYRDMVTSIMILRRHIRALAGEVVGIMMPASVAADVLFLATQFAGKTPAMINWTLGPRNLEHCLKSSGTQRILTARALVTRLTAQGVDLGGLAERFVYIEDIVANLGRLEKLQAFVKSRFYRLGWGSLRAAASRATKTAVILFTSGSESTPKAVPLSHRNILANIRDAYDCFTVSRHDSILGILPPFHSFGLTVTTLLPLVLGVRVVHHPNPTDGMVVGRMIDLYKATILGGTPTFLSGILRASESRQLESLRLVVSGGEKCPARLYDTLARQCPQTTVLEGYGVTECSPMISVNHESDAHASTIGRVMGSLEYVLVDPELRGRVEPGGEGMLLVRGPSVFGGYLDYDGPSPFVELDGRSWYCTGDLMRQDAEGVLTFSGRLKRFVKLGGEMISLPAIEAVLAERFHREDDDRPPLAVVATPDEERPEVVMFAVGPIDRAAANQAIRAAGMSGLHNIRRVIAIDELPLLGTGKIDYRNLVGRLH
ncbi:MAG: AMP-binding protein [Phycisphaerae bacterium]|nr:AMP-binding protein [Phycisphaerae bacterium]